MWGGGWGVFAQKAPSSGEAYRYHTTAGRMVTQPTHSFRSVVRILVGWLMAAAAAANASDGGSDRRPKGLPSAALPLGHCLVCGERSSRCLWPRLPQTKNRNCVFLSD